MFRQVIFLVLILLSLTTRGADLSVSMGEVDAAIEHTLASMEADDPERDVLLKSYRDTRALIDRIEEQEALLGTYLRAREKAYEEAAAIRYELKQSLADAIPLPDEALLLPELQQLIQLDKTELSVLQQQLVGIDEQRDGETGRAVTIRQRLSELGTQEPDLLASLKLLDQDFESGGAEEARYWLTEAQYVDNREEKATLDEELLSQPMRLDLLSARRDKLSRDISVLEGRLAAMEQWASEKRRGEAQEALAAAETARADASGKHKLVRALADRNSIVSAGLAERSVAIEGFRAREIAAKSQAEQFERDLTVIERKLEILGMTTTVGEILREQRVRLPGEKLMSRQIAAIAQLIADSSLRQMELQDHRRQTADIRTYVDGLLQDEPDARRELLKDDLTTLALTQRDLINQAIDVEATYARALSDLDFSVHRMRNAVEQYRAFINERLLWIQSSDSLSWSIFTELPGQVFEAFSPGRWITVFKWYFQEIFKRPLFVFLIFVVTVMVSVTPQIKVRLVATGQCVGFVRTDSFIETLKALGYTALLAIKWPLLMFTLSLPLGNHADDAGLAVALHYALSHAAIYFLGLEVIRCLLFPRGLVESHFRWPTSRVNKLNRRVIRFERNYLVSIFLVMVFLHLYPTRVGGPIGTFAVIFLLFSITQFFYRMPHFVQDKMDHFFAEPQARLHSFWGALARATLAWTPLLMVVAVLFGYIYTVIEFTVLLIQTVVLFTGMLLLHELGMRWLRVTRRRLRLKVAEELAHAQAQAQETDDGEISVEEEILEHDPDLLDDEGTKFLNALLVLGSVLGLGAVWSGVFPALGILDSVQLWQSSDTVDGKELVVFITLGDLIGAMVIGLLGWVSVRRLPSLLEILLRQRMEIGAASAYAVATLFKYVLVTVSVISILSILGGSWSQIQWAVAALSLGIGFGLQEIVANFFSGLIILFEQPIRVGDTVTVGETTGVVTRIQMRATTIRDWDRKELLVPNKEFVTSRLLNWSLTDPVTRIHIQVGVAYGTDMDQALALVKEAAEEHSLIISDPAPFVTFEEFGDNSLTISLRCYLEELDKRLSTASSLRLAINRKLAGADISIAFPQRDVHLDASEPLDIRLLNADGVSTS